MTLPEFEALEERRMVSVRYARFNAGLLAATYYNAHRGESEPLEVWDFVPGLERSPEEKDADKLRASVRHGVLIAFSRMRGSVEQVRAEAWAMIERMTENGTEDAEAIVRSVFQEVIKQPWG